MKRFILVLAVGVLMAVMLVAMATPAFATPRFSTGLGKELHYAFAGTNHNGWDRDNRGLKSLHGTHGEYNHGVGNDNDP